MKLKRKVCELDGWQFSGSVDGPLPAFIVELLATAKLKVKAKSDTMYLTLQTSLGKQHVYPGNWILQSDNTAFVKTTYQINKDFDIIEEDKCVYSDIGDSD